MQRFPDRLPDESAAHHALICARIRSGFYDQDEILEQVCRSILIDLHAQHLRKSRTRSVEQPERLRGTRPARDPRDDVRLSTDADGRDGVNYCPAPLVAGGQGRTDDDVRGSMFVIVYVAAACLIWAVIGLVVWLF